MSAPIASRSIWIAVAIVAVVGSAAPVASSEAPAPPATPSDSLRGAVIRFVSHRYIHGVPYPDARAFGPEAFSVLDSLLRREDEKENWATIASTMGIIGAPGTFETLRRFVWERFHGDVDAATMLAIRSAQGGIGWAAVVDTAGAIDYLIRTSDPNVWGGVGWKPKERWKYTPENWDRVAVVERESFAKSSLWGLAATAMPRGVDHLVWVRTHTDSRSMREYAVFAIQMSQEVRRVGFEAYIVDQQRRLR